MHRIDPERERPSRWGEGVRIDDGQEPARIAENLHENTSKDHDSGNRGSSELEYCVYAQSGLPSPGFP